MRGDWASVIDAAYAPASSDTDWAANVIDNARPLFGGTAVGATAIRHGANLASAQLAFLAGEMASASAALFSDWLKEGVGPAIRALFYPRAMVASLRQLAATLPGRRTDPAMRLVELVGVGDALGMILHPAPGLAVVFHVPSKDAFRISRNDRPFYTRLAIHLEAGLRLRHRPEAVRAVISSSGKLLHVDAPEANAALASVVPARVRAIEDARHTRRREPEALGVWEALIGGGLSLVPRRVGSRREYLLVDNAFPRQHVRALTRREIDVVSFAARGLPAKHVGYALGISSTSVSTDLMNAAAKLGLATRIELVRIAALLARDPRASFPEAKLTAAEREVLRLVGEGLSNREIARIRSRSVRTIANQVASLLAKTKASNRRALLRT